MSKYIDSAKTAHSNTAKCFMINNISGLDVDASLAVLDSTKRKSFNSAMGSFVSAYKTYASAKPEEKEIALGDLKVKYSELEWLASSSVYRHILDCTLCHIHAACLMDGLNLPENK